MPGSREPETVPTHAACRTQRPPDARFAPQPPPRPLRPGIPASTRQLVGVERHLQTALALSKALELRPAAAKVVERRRWSRTTVGQSASFLLAGGLAGVRASASHPSAPIGTLQHSLARSLAAAPAALRRLRPAAVPRQDKAEPFASDLRQHCNKPCSWNLCKPSAPSHANVELRMATHAPQCEARASTIELTGLGKKQ